MFVYTVRSIDREIDGFVRRFASKKAYVLIYGATGCMLAGTYAYFNGTITTIEKRYRIPSRNTGIISTGNDMSSALVSAILSYYGGKGHRPRWMAMGKSCILYVISILCANTCCKIYTLSAFVYTMVQVCWHW